MWRLVAILLVAILFIACSDSNEGADPEGNIGRCPPLEPSQVYQCQEVVVEQSDPPPWWYYLYGNTGGHYHYYYHPQAPNGERYFDAPSRLNPTGRAIVPAFRGALAPGGVKPPAGVPGKGVSPGTSRGGFGGSAAPAGG